MKLLQQLLDNIGVDEQVTFSLAPRGVGIMIKRTHHCSQLKRPHMEVVLHPSVAYMDHADAYIADQLWKMAVELRSMSATGEKE